ncbi:MAG: ATP-binding protein [Polaribacter sp.]|uniref:sensor histidine kinase n=1 Tax=Polaribacter sp. TaxID=1920175 RepID=UPI003BAFAEFB
MKRKIAILLFFISCTLFSNNEVHDFFSAIRQNDFEKSSLFLNDVKNESLKIELYKYYNLITRGVFDTEDVTSNKKITEETQIVRLLNEGLFLYYKKGNEIEAFKILKEALEIAIKINNKVLICETTKAILDIYERFVITLYDESYNYFLNLHKKNAYDNLEIEINKYYEFSINLRYKYEDEKFIESLYSSFKNRIKDKDPYYLKVKNNIALCGYHYRITKNYEQALFHAEKAKLLLAEKESYLDKEKKQSVEILNGVLLYLSNKPEMALQKLESIIDNKSSDFIFKVLKRYKYYWLYTINSKLKTNALDSLKYKSKFLELQLDINHDESLRAVSDLETKYQTEKKEKENLELKAKNKKTEEDKIQFRNFLVISVLILFLISLIGILTIKNSKRKRILAQQNQELETQKNLTLIKEQEITTINAMVNGQEKERKQIAEDLHDNLGSVLATLKLHFENLKMNSVKKKIDQEELFNKTENLINEAYLKVRSIAHAKNAGVIANQGLLLAVQMMAEKISSADKIKIEVVHFGLHKRLENSLEITVFRIIQELITNIIKHAEAKNATINISLYDNNLNIIIEDDGKGFDIKKVNLKNGMGISSIKTRIKHLSGTFKIDATIGKGSSIIIDVPVS